MKIVHGASAKLFPNRRSVASAVAAASGKATAVRQPPSEDDIVALFSGVGEPDRAEVQLAENVLVQVVGGLSPLADTEAGLPDDVDELAEFPTPSEPASDPLLELYHPLSTLAIDEQLPVAQSTAPAVNISDESEEEESCTEPSAGEQLSTRPNPAVRGVGRYRPAEPARKLRPGKNRGGDSATHVRTSNWPSKPTGFHRADMISALDACPSASSVQLAMATSEHFQASREQTELLRTRYADLATMEGHVLAKVRRLLPVAVDANSAIAAVQRIAELCDRFADRHPPPPFE